MEQGGTTRSNRRYALFRVHARPRFAVRAALVVLVNAGALLLLTAPALADPPPGYCVGGSVPVLVNSVWVCTP
jgi:hypothetical protein